MKKEDSTLAARFFFGSIIRSGRITNSFRRGLTWFPSQWAFTPTGRKTTALTCRLKNISENIAQIIMTAPTFS